MTSVFVRLRGSKDPRASVGSLISQCPVGAPSTNITNILSSANRRNQTALPEDQYRQELYRKRPHDRCTAPALRVTRATARAYTASSCFVHRPIIATHTHGRTCTALLRVQCTSCGTVSKSTWIPSRSPPSAGTNGATHIQSHTAGACAVQTGTS